MIKESYYYYYYYYYYIGKPATISCYINDSERQHHHMLPTCE